MQIKIVNYLLVVVVIGLISSCTVERAKRYVYASQAANNPFFKQKGDSKITGYYSGDGNEKNDGLNVQGAYAISNNLIVAAAYGFKKETQKYSYDSIRFYRSGLFGGYLEANIYDSSVINYKRDFFEFGLGYILPLNKKKTTSYNLYAGVALGNFSASDAGLDSTSKNYTRYYNAKTTKWYLQGSLNVMESEYFYFSVGGKLSILKYNSINTSYTTGELDYFYLNKIDGKSFSFLEPFINVQLGTPKLKWIKVDGQFSFSTKMPNAYPQIKTFNASIGLTLYPSKIKIKNVNGGKKNY